MERRSDTFPITVLTSCLTDENSIIELGGVVRDFPHVKVGQDLGL